MKDTKKGNITWNSKWEPTFNQSEALSNIRNNDIKVDAYSSHIQVPENCSVGSMTPEVTWETSKEWVGNAVADSVDSFKDYLKKKIYKPEGITVEQFSLALSKGAKFANTLLNRGYNINKQDSQGNTAFMIACQNFKRDWIDFLLDAGADVNIANNENETPLMFVCKNSSFEVKGKVPIPEDTARPEVEKLKEHNQSRKDMAFDTFSTLVRVGAELNVKSNTGFTALTYAVRRGNSDIVQRAIELGSEIDIVNKDGATALDIAIDNGYITISQLLFQLEDDQFTTLKRIQSKYPSNPKFVKFFEILYRSNIEEQLNSQNQTFVQQNASKNFYFLNKQY